MKYWVLNLLILLSAFSCKAQQHVDFILEKLRTQNEDYILFGAHRGDWRNEPENSLEAIQRCIDQGLDIVEIDLRKTKDGQLIIMHDKTLDRTTTGTGKISEHTWEEISKLYLKNPLGIPTRQRVPTLQQALQLTRGKILVFLDKAEAYIPELQAVLHSMNMANQVILFGREQASYGVLKEQFGKLLHTTIFIPVLKSAMSDIPGYIDELNKTIHPLAYAFEFGEEDTAVLNYIPQVRTLSSKIWISTLWASMCGGHDDEQSVHEPDMGWGWVLQHHAGIILTDRPAEMAEYLNKQNRRIK